jgi:hypothetical protein
MDGPARHRACDGRGSALARVGGGAHGGAWSSD